MPLAGRDGPPKCNTDEDVRILGQIHSVRACTEGGFWRFMFVRGTLTVTGVMGFEPPSWQAVTEVARPEVQPPDEFEPGGVRQGWQHEAASRSTPSHTGIGLSSVLRLDLAQVLLCEWSPQAVSPEFKPISFVSSFGASGCPSPSPSAVAGVAAPLTSCSLHSQLQGYAGRLEVGSPQTLSCGILTVPAMDNRHLEVVVDSLALFGGSQLAIKYDPRARCNVMALHTLESSSVMEAFSRRHTGGRSDGTQNWWDLAAELDWWCLPWKLGAGGQLIPGLSLLLELSGSTSADGECPSSHEVVGDHLYAGLP